MFLGLVAGLTEFLPVSSTTHIVAELLIGHRDVGATLTSMIQLGALLRGRPSARRFRLNLVIASLPAALVGLLFEQAIKATLFSPTTVGISLIVGGVLLWESGPAGPGRCGCPQRWTSRQPHGPTYPASLPGKR